MPNRLARHSGEPTSKSGSKVGSPRSNADVIAVVVQPDPVADVGQIVVAGNVRVSVLTDRLLRVEYSPDGSFEDRPSLAVANRKFPTTTYETLINGSSLTVRTAQVTLKISDVTRPFSSRRVTAERNGDGARWHFGMVDRSNLGGTVRTLDNWDGNRLSRYAGWDDETGIQLDWEEQGLEPGLLSRSGWTVFDDSGSVVLDPRSAGRSARGRSWPTSRESGDSSDIYLFGYGESHIEALAAAARLFGPQPLPPRFAFGYWYSRYFPYTDAELLAVTDELDQFGIPADVLVIDMDWHRLGWTGYSWDHDLFPDPSATLAAVHERGLKVCLNLHPADGVGSHEDAFEAMCEAMALDPATTERIPFDVTDPDFVDAYLRLLHHPEEDRGVDFWWMDWQQGTDTPIEGLDPLAWLNHLHWHDAVARRPKRRPLNFSRWDGLGAGRHPVGFSGDTYATWESLAFQPEFTATAANVLYGYWSHDIGGHIGSTPDPELYTRWLQFGVHSPVLRTHGTLDPLAERKVWEFPSPYRGVMIDAIRRRYELIPYIYGECRRGLEDGRSLVRPMYHENPDMEEAYEVPGQYYFGADMIVAPVVEPIGDDSMGGVKVWLPQGEWFDTAHGTTLNVDAPSGQTLERRYLLAETPVFVRAGAVIPNQRDAARLDTASYEKLTLVVHPGDRGRHDLYEDDGTSQGYLSGRSVATPIEHRSTAGTRSVRIGPAVGNYRGWKRRRDVEIHFPNELPPQRVAFDERPIPRSAGPAVGHWWYDPRSATTCVSLPNLDLKLGATLRVERSRSARSLAGDATSGLDSLVGQLRRLSLADQTVRTLLGDDNRRIVSLFRALESSALGSAADVLAAVRSVRNDLPELVSIMGRHADGHRSIEAVKPAEPPVNSVLIESMRRVLEQTLHQF